MKLFSSLYDLAQLLTQAISLVFSKSSLGLIYSSPSMLTSCSLCSVGMLESLRFPFTMHFLKQIFVRDTTDNAS